MNKVFLGLILAVCVLGMALVMLNDRLGRKPEPRPTPVADATPLPGRSPEEIAAQSRAMELAKAALAPPQTQEAPEAATPPRPRPVPEAKPEPAKPEPVKMAAEEPASLKKTTRSEETKPEPPKAAESRIDPVPDLPAPKAKDKAEAQKTEAGAPKGNAESKSANKFVIYARDKGATVRVGSNAKMNYSSMTLENPNRVVVDLDGDWTFPPHPGVPKNDLVSSVRVGQYGDKTRMVIDLKIKPRKVVLVPAKNGTGVDVRVDK